MLEIEKDGRWLVVADRRWQPWRSRASAKATGKTAGSGHGVVMARGTVTNDHGSTLARLLRARELPAMVETTQVGGGAAVGCGP